MNSILSFKEIYFKCNAKPLYEQVLREMADFHYTDGETVIRNYVKSEHKNHIYTVLHHILLQQSGNTDGVRYFDKNGQVVTIDNWLNEIFDNLKNTETIPEVLGNIDRVKSVFTKTIKELRKINWKENTPFTKADKFLYKAKIDSLKFSET